AREISKKKPILVMKGGRTRAGGSAAASHSGAMAGSMNVFRAAFKQAGVIEASNTQELIDCAKAFSHFPILRGNRIGIITRGGGWGVLAADACEEAGLEVPPLADYLIKEMDKLLPRYWNRKNPVDLVATIASDPFPKCIEMMAEWDGIDAIIALGAGFQAFSYNFSDQLKGPKELMDTVGFMKGYFEDRGKHPNSTLKLIGDLTAQTGKPIISVTIGSDRSQKHYSKQYDVVAFPTPERAVRVLKHMYDYSRFLNSIG
ncbi:CoA-binding protein, partial [bacterium]|nr:CoA-binding protein [bacterium]